jgi:hypothetical protein
LSAWIEKYRRFCPRHSLPATLQPIFDRGALISQLDTVMARSLAALRASVDPTDA